MSDTDLLHALSSMIDSKLEPLINKQEMMFDELMKVEKYITDIDQKCISLHEKHDTLLLRADNSTLLLSLINRLEERVKELEKKLA